MKSIMKKTRDLIVALAASLVAAPAFAQLPTPTTPTGATAGSSDFITVLKGFFEDGSSVIILAVSVAMMIGIGWVIWTKFSECRAGKAEWGEFGVTAGVGAVVGVVGLYLLNIADQVI